MNLPAAIANAAASTLTVVYNAASAFTIGSTGKADILKIVSTDDAEGVSMSGTLDVTGVTTLSDNTDATSSTVPVLLYRVVLPLLKR